MPEDDRDDTPEPSSATSDVHRPRWRDVLEAPVEDLTLEDYGPDLSLPTGRPAAAGAVAADPKAAPP